MADRALEIISMKDPAAFGLAPDILRVGDKIVEVAGHAAPDQIDFHFYASQPGQAVRMTVERVGGVREEIVVPAEAVGGLELWFKAMDFRRCRCKCPFCFVDQMPKGMRESLYVKDEDFRLSFLYGNFTTMNDITDAEIDKIIEQNNTPQWVSVHVVEEEMRRFIFGRPMKRNILDTLRRLGDGGIRVHTQAVIIPGKNDGAYLRETIEVLEALHQNIATLAVVPVGLTRHRDGLPGIRSFRDEEMGAVLDLIQPYRERYRRGGRESAFVFPSDEWYVGADREVPDYDDYEGFAQLDNGVGSIRSFVTDIEDDLAGQSLPGNLDSVRIVTGSLGARVFRRYVMPRLAAHGVGRLPRVVEVENDFFGASVTCSGLLVGADMIAAVKAGGGGGSLTVIPPNCLNHDGVTIDEMTPTDMADAIGAPVVAPEESFIDALRAVAGEGSVA